MDPGESCFTRRKPTRTSTCISKVLSMCSRRFLAALSVMTRNRKLHNMPLRVKWIMAIYCHDGSGWVQWKNRNGAWTCDGCVDEDVAHGRATVVWMRTRHVDVRRSRGWGQHRCSAHCPLLFHAGRPLLGSAFVRRGKEGGESPWISLLTQEPPQLVKSQ